MREHTITTSYREYDYAELPTDVRRLIDAAKEMTAGSYAPYSNFNVGAAILLEDGTIVRGANQENAAYPSGICAERTACYQAGALHPGVAMKRIAIAAATDGKFQKNPISPCGACRQALMEYENKFGPIEVVLYGENGVYVIPSVASLLPLTFTEF
ncbi:MAG: cytidine deaminase [Muribaculaceae bacterium]|nr:cytidine deaminase [Muribaculaceae bacterium]